MMAAIDEAKANGDSIGGIVEVIVEGMPVGVGSYVHYDRKLDSKLAAAVLSINAFKGVEFGIGFEAAGKNGSEVHDEIVWDEERLYTRHKQARRIRRRYDDGNADCRPRRYETDPYFVQAAEKRRH